MSRYLLDTNIIGNVTKPAPSASLVAWMAEQADEVLFISSFTVAASRKLRSGYALPSFPADTAPGLIPTPSGHLTPKAAVAVFCSVLWSGFSPPLTGGARGIEAALDSAEVRALFGGLSDDALMAAALACTSEADFRRRIRERG